MSTHGWNIEGPGGAEPIEQFMRYGLAMEYGMPAIGMAMREFRAILRTIRIIRRPISTAAKPWSVSAGWMRRASCTRGGRGDARKGDLTRGMKCRPRWICWSKERVAIRKFGPWRSLASALAWGARGPGFKSRRPDHFFKDSQISLS